MIPAHHPIQTSTKNPNNLIFIHNLYSFPVYSINDKFKEWESIDNSISYDYVVNGIKYQKNKSQFSKIPRTSIQANSVLIVFTCQFYAKQINSIQKLIKRIFSNIHELVILLISLLFGKLDILKVKKFIESFEGLKKVTILLKEQSLSKFIVKNFHYVFTSINIPFKTQIYQTKARLRVKEGVIGKNSFSLFEETHNGFENVIKNLEKSEDEVLGSMEKLVQWDCVELHYLYNKETPSILKTIGNIQFQYLRKLIISYTSLESIEPLVVLRAFNLKHLMLTNNYITCISSLCKIYLKQLEEIDLEQNKIVDVPSLSPCGFEALRNINLVYAIQKEQQKLRGKCFETVKMKIGFLAKLKQNKFNVPMGIINMNRELKRALLRKYI